MKWFVAWNRKDEPEYQFSMYDTEAQALKAANLHINNYEYVVQGSVIVGPVMYRSEAERIPYKMVKQ